MNPISNSSSPIATGAQIAAAWHTTALWPNVYDGRWSTLRVARFGSGRQKAELTIATQAPGSRF
jgi:hypothetical protein